MQKKLILIIFSIMALVGLSGCSSNTDVIGTTSIKSFEKVLNIIPDQVTEDEAYLSWSLAASDGSARFIWSKDFSQTQTYDAFLEVDAQPFINAGLDINKLQGGFVVGDKIIVGTDFGNDNLTYEGDVTPLESYKQIVKLYRDSIKYHVALDHYGVALGNGNTFEWAKDMAKNDKDIVFVLNPQVFIDAGVDPNAVDGWVFAKVDTMDENGKKVQLDKFLKPFDLDGLKK